MRMTTWPLIRLDVQGITLQRGYRVLTDNLGFTLKGGELLQLMGANGSGKSTLLRALAGFLRPEAGVVRWEGVGEEAQAQIHYLGHKDGLRGALTPQENLAFYAGLLRGDHTDIPAVLEEMSVKRLADLPVDLLSAGQRKRVALARLLLIPRPIWLLDEPLNALDAAGQAVLIRVIKHHLDKGGIVIAATHHPLEGEGLSPHVLSLSSPKGMAA